MRTALSIALIQLLATAVSCRAPQGAPPVKQVSKSLQGDSPVNLKGYVHPNIRPQLESKQAQNAWKSLKSERKSQVQDLQKIRGRAFADAKSEKWMLRLVRESKGWRVTSPFVQPLASGSPREVAALLAQALKEGDMEQLVALLSAARREQLGTPLMTLAESLAKQAPTSFVDIVGNTANVRWSYKGNHFRLVLIREEGQWRLDDIHVQSEPDGFFLSD